MSKFDLNAFRLTLKWHFLTEKQTFLFPKFRFILLLFSSSNVKLIIISVQHFNLVGEFFLPLLSWDRVCKSSSVCLMGMH